MWIPHIEIDEFSARLAAKHQILKMDRVARSQMMSAISEEQDFSGGPLGQIDHSFARLASRPGFLIRRLHQINYAMLFEEFQSRKVTPIQYGVLSVVETQPALDQTTLGKEIGLDRTTTADVVKRLVERGLLRREHHPVDKRMWQLYITAEGGEVIAALRDGMTRAQERLLAPLRPAEQAMLMDLMTRMVEANPQYGSPMRAF